MAQYPRNHPNINILHPRHTSLQKTANFSSVGIIQTISWQEVRWVFKKFRDMREIVELCRKIAQPTKQPHKTTTQKVEQLTKPSATSAHKKSRTTTRAVRPNKAP
jgi:16S rRNA C1402 N4-methylase RsmH